MKDTIDWIRKFRNDRDWSQFHTPANLSKEISIEEREKLLDEYESYIKKQENRISELTEEQLQLLKVISNMKISLLASK